MIANTPTEIYELFGEYFSAGTIDLLLSLYEVDAVLIRPDAEAARGKESIREVLNGFLGLHGKFRIGSPKIAESGGIALISAKWTLTGGKGPGGEEINLAGRTSDVIRKQPDGDWLFVVDCPYGMASQD